MNVRERRAEDLEAVRGLLKTGGLPSEGLERTIGWIAEENGEIISHVALEEADDAVILRSLATALEAQCRGVARQLMDIAETHAGNRTILLRTKTVGPWVLRRSYAPIASGQIPASVRSTSEFEGSMCSGCPIYKKG